jgi:hypothetical protein
VKDTLDKTYSQLQELSKKEGGPILYDDVYKYGVLGFMGYRKGE